MAEFFYYICYSNQDGEETALRLADQLAAGPPSISVWIDRRKLQPGIDRYQQIVQALNECQGVLYLMTKDSADPNCPCTQEWLRALKYKKPIIPLLMEPAVELPFRLEPRESIQFAEAFDSGLARLREHLRWRETDDGRLQTMNERLRDARRDFRDASASDKVRIEDEIGQLQQQIDALNAAIKNPRAAEERTRMNIQRGLERERQPLEPVARRAETRFINRPPLIAPAYFQNRHVETALIGDFLRDEDKRLITVVGRGGVGKTAMVCRLLRSLEGGKLPDDGGDLAVDGIVYLSERSGHQVRYPNLFYDVARLLPAETARYLDQLYKDPGQTCRTQMAALLAQFPQGRTIVLLDNFEDVVDPETQSLKEPALDEALRTVLESAPHGLKVILTTRVAPRALLRVQPALQIPLELDEGLESPYAEAVLQSMDVGNKLGLHSPDAPLDQARAATRGFPRALEAIVGILRTDRSTDLRDLLQELRQLGSKAEDVVRDLVGEAFNRLDPLAQEVMQSLAVYGAPVPAVAVDYLLQPHRIGIDSSRTLARLVSMHFVRGEAGRFYLHPVDREYALSRLPEGKTEDRRVEPPPFTRFALLHRAAEYYKEVRKPRETWKKLEDVAAQLAEFEFRMAVGDYDNAAGVLTQIDDGYLSLWGHYRVLVDRYKRLRGKPTDPEMRWRTVSGLGDAYRRIGLFAEELQCYDEALSLARDERNGLNRAFEASALFGLASFYDDSGDHEKAIELGKQVLGLYESLGDMLGEARTRGDLANRYSDLGRTVEARQQYEIAMALSRKIPDREGECTHTYNFADFLSDLDDASAPTVAEDALRIAREIGFRLIESAAATLLANLLVRESRFDEAARLFEDAVRLADETGAIQMQMGALYSFAKCLLFAGNLTEARRVAEDATKFRFPSGYASTLALAGVVAAIQGEGMNAVTTLERALAESEALQAGQSQAYEPAYSKALGLAALAVCGDSSRAVEAAEAYREARKIFAAPGLVRDEVRCLDALSIVDRSGLLRPVRVAAAGARETSLP